MAIRSSKKLHWLGTVLLAAAMLAALAVAQAGAGGSLLRKTGLTGGPARYTELAFAAPMYLPEKLPPNRVPIHAPFWIHNVEGTRRTYNWAFRELEGAKVTVLARGRVVAAAGERVRVNPALQVTCRAVKRARIELRIDNPPRSIDWWADCLAPPKGASR